MAAAASATQDKTEPETKPEPAKRKFTAANPSVEAATKALAAALADAEHPDHEAAVAYVDENFAAQVDAEEPLHPDDRPTNIIEALVAVMREVRAVGKDGRNTQGKGYDFRGIDGTVNALGPALRKVGVMVLPQVRTHHYGEVVVGNNRTQQAHSRVEVEYTFCYSNLAGEVSKVSAVTPGEAMDSGDKATAKSMSVAFRTCLLQTFAVPTHEPDPDESTYVRSPALEPIPAEQLKAACVKAASFEDQEKAFQDLRVYFGDRLGISHAANSEGETLSGDAYVDYAEKVAADWRAKKLADEARAAQDKAAEQGDQPATTETPEAQPEQQPEASTQAEPEQTPTQEEPPAATEPAPEQQPQQQRQPEVTPQTRQERMLALAIAETEWQADIVGMNVADYAESITATKGDLSTIIPPKATRFLISNRGTIITLLRERGEATVADALESKKDAFPLVLSQITGQEAGHTS